MRLRCLKPECGKTNRRDGLPNHPETQRCLHFHFFTHQVLASFSKPRLSMAQDCVHDAHGNQPGIWNCVLGCNQGSSPCISAFTLNDSSHVRFQQMSTEVSRNCLMDLSCTSHLEPGSCTNSRVGNITGLLPTIDH